MKIKCVECELVIDIRKEDICAIKSMTENGQISKTTDYLEIFNITKGKCKDQKRHTFIFEESFCNYIQGMINSYNDTVSRHANDEKELSKTVDEIADLENKLRSAKEKREGLTESIKKAETYTENILQEFEKATGDKRIDIWD